MRPVLLVAASLLLACGGSNSSTDAPTDARATDATETAPIGDLSADLPKDTTHADLGTGDLDSAVADLNSAEGTTDLPLGDAAPDTAPLDTHAADLQEVHDLQSETLPVPENLVPTLSPSCAGCQIVQVESWDGASPPNVPTAETFAQEFEGQMFYFRPWVRFRLPHPGIVQRVLVYTQGAGHLQVGLSTGFPGGHYPCLDEASGKDLYPAGKMQTMEISQQPGWRAFEVGNLAPAGAGDLPLQVGGLDEFFVLFDQAGETRVGLAPSMPAQPGDYPVYGGLIADAPGDSMGCFPTMSQFEAEDDTPMVWIVRVEYQPTEILESRWFLDDAGAGLLVGGHASFGDYDNDGDDDLLSYGTLWRNDGAGIFSNVTAQAGLTELGGETLWGDFDNDGYRDILGIGSQAMLYRNLGDGTFSDVTESSGILINASSQGAAWLDFDQDGYLDFYAASYGTLADPEVPERDYLFHNNQDGTFTDVTQEMGIPITGTKLFHGRGVCVADYDQDGDPDIYVGNYRLDPNRLWNNKGGLDGFEDAAYSAKVQGWFQMGGFGHTIGPSFGDLNGDSLMDLMVPNLAHPRFLTFSDTTTTYLNSGDGTFAGFQAPERGIRYDETHSDSTLLDVDNDGDLDLFLTAVYEGRRSYLYANDGTASFTDVTYPAGIAHFNGWGSAASDVDGDGDLDLVANRLFRNQNPNVGHYLKVKLTGGCLPGDCISWSNRDAIGAVATLTWGSHTLVRQVEGGKSLGCQNSPTLHFGLGTEVPQLPLQLKILWPSGRTTTVDNVQPDVTLSVSER